MKLLIANDQATLTSLGGSDETTMFPQNAVITITSGGDSVTDMFVASSTDTDDSDRIRITHADKSAAATHKAERETIDALVSAINSDSRLGYTVLFDKLNGVYAPGIDGTLAMGVDEDL